MTWAQVRAWRIERHRLTNRSTPDEPIAALARAMCGVHAQLMSAAELSIKARRDHTSVADVRAALYRDRTLYKTWAMRGTLHLLPAEDVAWYVAALRPRTSTFRLSWQRFFEVTAEEVEQLMDAIGAALDGKCLTRGELADEVARITGLPKMAEHLRRGWGSLLKPAAYRGILCFAQSQGQNVRFARPDQWLGPFPALDSRVAQREMLRRYVFSFGPATREHFARWWGSLASMNPVWKAALADGELAEVELEDGVRAWALSADVDRLTAIAPPEATHVRLLPHFDGYLMGFGPRTQLVTPALVGRVFRPQGWISPVVLVGGRVVGVWEPKRGTAVVELFEPLSKPQRRALEADAARLGFELDSQLAC
ncbi:MAG TPA: winged helix DNA-binding domain-containing protein [Chloroflexota bacterium]